MSITHSTVSLGEGAYTGVPRDGAYVQFIRPRGPLEANLRAQLKA